MTPEEHIEMAERIIHDHRNDVEAIRAAEVHVSVAFFKKQYPPESGRPVPVMSQVQLCQEGRCGHSVCESVANRALGPTIVNPTKKPLP